ncbi:MAG: DUF4190 domain-containing protein [Planctomycetota bacterium]|jgi:hypothetical protein
MNCPKCGEPASEEGKFCPACGEPYDAEAKVLCPGCMGAFPAKDLEPFENRRLCPLCKGREERRREGVPSAGNPRMMHEARQFRGHEVYRRPANISILAVASLVAAFVCPLVGLPAILLGVVALIRIRGREDLTGSGFALAGIGVGVLTAVLMVGGGFLVAPFALDVWNQVAAEDVRREMERIRDAEKMYHLQNGEYAELDQLIFEGLWDPMRREIPGYEFTVKVNPEGFRVIATPTGMGFQLHFLLDEMGAFHEEKGKPATPKSPPMRKLQNRTSFRRTSG